MAKKMDLAVVTSELLGDDEVEESQPVAPVELDARYLDPPEDEFRKQAREGYEKAVQERDKILARMTGEGVPPSRPRAEPKFGDKAKSRRVQLLMQPALHDRLKVLAAQSGKSVNEYIHTLLETATKEA